VDSTGVIIERLDEHIQTRDIEKNFRIKKTKHTYCGAMYTKLKTTRQLRYTMQSYVGRECGVEVYETMGTVWVEEGNGWNVMRVIGDGKVWAGGYVCMAFELMGRPEGEDVVQSQWMEEWVNHCR